MRIQEYSSSDRNADLRSDGLEGDQSDCSKDSCFFASLLERSPEAGGSRNASYIPGALTDAIAPLTTSKTSMAKLLKSTRKEIDIDQFRKFPSLLSNIQLMSQLSVKCLAKTTQGLDKICNLQ